MKLIKSLDDKLQNKYIIIYFGLIFLAGLYQLHIYNFSYFEYFFLNNIFLDYFVGFFFSILIFYILRGFFYNEPIILVCWLIKVFFIFFISIYIESIYLIDKDGYYVNGILFSIFFENNQGGFISQLTSNFSTTRFVHFINFIFLSILPNSIYFFKVFYSLLSFLAVIFLASFLKKEICRSIFLLILCLSFSLNIFTSDVNKDSLIVFLVSLVLYRLKKDKIFLFEILFYIFLIFFIRKWIGILVLLIFIFNILISNANNFLKYTLILISILFVPTFLTMSSLFGISTDFFSLIDVLRLSFTGGKANFTPVSLSNYFDLIILPITSLKIIFIPFFNNFELFTIFASFENLFFIFIFSITFFFLQYKKSIKQLLEICRDNINLFLYIFSWLIMYAPIISNYGSLIRYKVTFTPMLLLIFFIFIDRLSDKINISK